VVPGSGLDDAFALLPDLLKQLGSLSATMIITEQ
jgi:hypothetical protein